MGLVDKLKGSVRRGDFVLSSGKRSDYYIDVKKAITDPGTLREIAVEMAALIKDEGVDRVAGIAVGAVPLATAVGLEMNIPFLVVRKERKGHGTRAEVEGELEPGAKVVVLEDVITTGASSLTAVEAIRDRGGRCDEVLVVVDREEGAGEMLKEHGIELKPLVKASELLSEEQS